MILVSEISLVGVWVIMALYQAALIRHNRPIYHGWWGLVSAALIALAACLVFADLRTGWHVIVYVAAQGAFRLPVFNVSLNLFRGKKWDYMSATSGSILDKIETEIDRGNVWFVYIACSLAFLTAQFII